MKNLKRISLLSATGFQLSAAMMSFLIILILKNKLDLESFAALSSAFFLSGIVVALNNLKLGRKYFVLVRDMRLSPIIWMTQRFSFFIILAIVTYLVAHIGGVAPRASALIFFIYLSAIDLIPKGYFEAEQAIINATAQFTERVVQIILVFIDPALFFQWSVPVRMFMVLYLWAIAFYVNRGETWNTLSMEHIRRFGHEVRLYAPTGFVNTVMLQAPIWFGGIHTDPTAISNLAIIRQATLFPRNFSAVASNIFHQSITSRLPKFFVFYTVMMVITSVGLIVLLYLLNHFITFGGSVEITLLVVIWSIQIVFVNLLGKRMSLKELDTDQFIAAILGLIIALAMFFMLKIEMGFAASYVLAIVAGHTISIALAYWVSAKKR